MREKDSRGETRDGWCGNGRNFLSASVVVAEGVIATSINLKERRKDETRSERLECASLPAPSPIGRMIEKARALVVE